MVDNQVVLKNSFDLFKLFQEAEKYKKYIIDINDKDYLKADDIIKNGELTLFGTEIFQFWVESIKVQNTEKSAFIGFAKSVGIPVRGYHIEPHGLSWLGRAIYAVWCKAIEKTD